MQTLDKQPISDQTESGFYGEWAYFENDEEKEDAYKYLVLWKKFMLKKLSGLKQKGHDHIVLRPNIFDSGFSTLGIKIEMVRDE